MGGGASTGNRWRIQNASEYWMLAFRNGRRGRDSNGPCNLSLGACLAFRGKDGTGIRDGGRIRKQASHCGRRRLRHIGNGSRRCWRPQGIRQFGSTPTRDRRRLRLMWLWLCRVLVRVLRLSLRRRGVGLALLRNGREFALLPHGFQGGLLGRGDHGPTLGTQVRDASHLGRHSEFGAALMAGELDEARLQNRYAKRNPAISTIRKTERIKRGERNR